MENSEYKNKDKEYAIKLAQCFRNRQTFISCGVETWKVFDLAQQRIKEDAYIENMKHFRRRSERLAVYVAMYKPMNDLRLIGQVFKLLFEKQISLFIRQ